MAGGRLLQLWHLPICDGGVACNPYEIFGGKCGSVTDLSRKASAFPYQYLFHPFSKLIYRQTFHRKMCDNRLQRRILCPKYGAWYACMWQVCWCY